MIGFEVFMLGLLISSVFTGLATEAVKNVLNEYTVKYRANTLAGIVALVIAALISVAYIFIANVVVTAQIIVCLVALVFLSWLCAMVGYDKVVQAISQFKTISKESDSE